MSVAKPILKYVDSIGTRPDFSRAGKALRVILSYEKKYFYYPIFLVLLSVLRSYFFSLEPLYTAQIIDNVAIGGQFNLLLGLVLNIVLGTMGFAVSNFTIVFLEGRVAEFVVRDIRTK